MSTPERRRRPGERASRTGFCIALSLLATSALAAHESPFANTDLAFGDDVPVVLSASRLRQPVDESPASVTIIDRELIEQSGARSLVDVLLLVPGFQVGYRLRGNPVAAYHGVAQRYNAHLQLFIDGRPTYVPLFGGVPWHELPIALSDVERIEVTRAPNAATFGPNSFATVISVTTREPASDTGWRGSLEGGGNDFASSTLSWHGAVQTTDYRFSLQASNDEGYDDLPDTSRARLMTLRAIRRLHAKDRVIVDAGALQGGHIELDPIEIPEDFAPYEETTNLYAQLVWERAESADNTWRVQYYYNRFNVDDDSEYVADLGELTGNAELDGTPLTVNFDRDTESSRHEIELQRTRRLASNHRIVYGFAVRQDTISGRYVFNDYRAHRVDTQRLFGHSEFEPHRKLLLQAGLLAEHNSLSGSAIAPRVSLTFRNAPRQRIRLAYSRGLRTPQPIEEEGEIVFDYQLDDGSTLRDYFINDDGRSLDPEVNDVFDIGYHYTTAGGRFALDTKLSHQRIRDLLSNRRGPVAEDTFDGEARAFDNRYDYTWNNVDLELVYRPSIRLQLRTGYAYAFGLDSEVAEGELTPQHTLSLFAGYKPVPTVTLSGEFYYVSDWIWSDERDFRTHIERLDLRAARRFRAGSLNAEVAVQAELELGPNSDYVERNDVADQYFAKISFQLP